ncbi:putative lipoprotein [Eubacterium sulci ATCC 35585]|nr:putative lipoprotein [Eubacterium sulci ATCC 35585]
MKGKKRMRITVKNRKTTAKEKIIGGIVWGILIGCIVYLAIK